MLKCTEWLNLLRYLTASWDGLIMVTGDINIDLLGHLNSVTIQYLDMLSALNLYQHVQKPTRTTYKSSTLIEHITVFPHANFLNPLSRLQNSMLTAKNPCKKY